MLGKTAGGLYWMTRYLERSENTARLVEAGFRIALTRSSAAEEEWSSILSTAAVKEAYLARHGRIESARVIDFLLRDPVNPSSVVSVIEAARNNARLVRTALTREVWEGVNEAWMALKAALAGPVALPDLPGLLSLIRQRSALVRGAMHGTKLRNDIFNFLRLGTFIERGDNTARILDVKYYVLLPSVSLVGSSLDNVQWETILRSASAERAFGWLHGGETSPRDIAHFLILDGRMPRSLAFCAGKLVNNLGYLATDYGVRLPCHAQADRLHKRVTGSSIEAIFETGLHEFLLAFVRDNNALGRQIEIDYRFTE